MATSLRHRCAEDGTASLVQVPSTEPLSDNSIVSGTASTTTSVRTAGLGPIRFHGLISWHVPHSCWRRLTTVCQMPVSFSRIAIPHPPRSCEDRGPTWWPKWPNKLWRRQWWAHSVPDSSRVRRQKGKRQLCRDVMSLSTGCSSGIAGLDSRPHKHRVWQLAHALTCLENINVLKHRKRRHSGRCTWAEMPRTP